jgi:hypothetical protein
MNNLNLQELLNLAEECGASVRRFKYQSTTSVTFKDDQILEFASRLLETAEVSDKKKDTSVSNSTPQTPTSAHKVMCSTNRNQQHVIYMRAYTDIGFGLLMLDSSKDLAGFVKDCEESNRILVIFTTSPVVQSYIMQKHIIPDSENLMLYVIESDTDVERPKSVSSSIHYVTINYGESWTSTATTLENNLRYLLENNQKINHSVERNS